VALRICTRCATHLRPDAEACARCGQAVAPPAADDRPAEPLVRTRLPFDLAHPDSHLHPWASLGLRVGAALGAVGGLVYGLLHLAQSRASFLEWLNVLIVAPLTGAFFAGIACLLAGFVLDFYLQSRQQAAEDEEARARAVFPGLNPHAAPPTPSPPPDAVPARAAPQDEAAFAAAPAGPAAGADTDEQPEPRPLLHLPARPLADDGPPPLFVRGLRAGAKYGALAGALVAGGAAWEQVGLKSDVAGAAFLGAVYGGALGALGLCVGGLLLGVLRALWEGPGEGINTSAIADAVHEADDRTSLPWLPDRGGSDDEARTSPGGGEGIQAPLDRPEEGHAPPEAPEARPDTVRGR
jgi:hypothetical protein